MSELVNVKLRRIGTSLGVILPKRIIDEQKLKEGKTIDIAIIRKNPALIDKMFGIARDAKVFVRDRRDRVNDI